MRTLLVALLVGTSFLAIVPTVDAHQCQAARETADCGCPIPNDGQYHQHAAGSNVCQGGPGGQQSASPGGASQSVPFGGVALALAAVLLVAAIRRA